MARLHNLSTLTLVGTLMGCGASLATEVPRDATIEREGESLPAWTAWESWSEVHDGKTYVYAVGLDEDLYAGEDDARAAASIRAAEALARYIRTRTTAYVTRGGDRVVARSAQVSDAVDDGEHTRSVQTDRAADTSDRLARAVETLARGTLHGVETVFVISERRGVVYARARAELTTLLDGFEAESMRAEQHEDAQARFSEARALMRKAVEADVRSPAP
jgi:hypothetical protein